MSVVAQQGQQRLGGEACGVARVLDPTPGLPKEADIAKGTKAYGGPRLRRQARHPERLVVDLSAGALAESAWPKVACRCYTKATTSA